jgi:hypothetical protein
VPPALSDLLGRYVEDRRPPHLAAAEWQACDEILLRRGPTTAFALGRPAGRRRKSGHPAAADRPAGVRQG